MGNNNYRPLNTIAAEISRDWKPVNFAAKPYLDAMFSLDNMSDRYGADSASSIVAYFLSNANTWRGETARRVKAELNAMLKNKPVPQAPQTAASSKPKNEPVDPDKFLTWLNHHDFDKERKDLEASMGKDEMHESQKFYLVVNSEANKKLLHQIGSSAYGKYFNPQTYAYGTIGKAYLEPNEPYEVKPIEVDWQSRKRFNIGDRVMVGEGTGLDSKKVGTIVPRTEVKTDGRGIPTNVSGAYKPTDWSKEVAIRVDSEEIITMFKNRLGHVVNESSTIIKEEKSHTIINRSTPMYMVLSSCGNPDHDEDPNEELSPREVVEVFSFAEASKKARAYIEKWNLGGGNWNGGKIYWNKELKGAYAVVSYNGRVWNGEWDEKFRPSLVYDPTNESISSSIDKLIVVDDEYNRKRCPDLIGKIYSDYEDVPVNAHLKPYHGDKTNEVNIQSNTAKVFKHFTLKVANMRNSQDFVLYPYDGGDWILLQSDKRIAQVSIRSGKGIISNKNQDYPTVQKLGAGFLFFVLPPETLKEIQEYLKNASGFVSNGVIGIENKPYNENMSKLITKFDEFNEKFSSKRQQRFFYYMAGKKGKKGKKWKRMAKEFSDSTDFSRLPENANESYFGDDQYEVSYYLEVGQHGGFQVPSMEAGLTRAREIKNDPNLFDEGTWMIEVEKYTDNEQGGVVVYCNEKYYNYIQSLGEDICDTPENTEIYKKALKECMETGKEVPYTFKDTEDNSVKEYYAEHDVSVMLTDEQKRAIKKWIDRGATFRDDIDNEGNAIVVHHNELIAIYPDGHSEFVKE